MGEEQGHRRDHPPGRSPPACTGAVLGAAQRHPRRFAHRVVILAPGEARPYVAAEWTDALVVVADGAVELEGLGGERRRLARGAVLWLVGLPLRAVRNESHHPAVIVAVSRRGRDGGAAG
ncbi:hypothetical protein HC251_05360 [Iamia sp. SCSIO 61187]|uniref:hypothetical protein n=1 Tax=Iamia sp. SCSIO 61187 TaxID=2722752 RepID=UPI001C628865|nr:hypothetical protein [Iamia sp. SCSIO 61187]QYG91923.1 hypothetical protein HC251_05360 [Iamia sp. SCSIO 61187]